MLRFNFTSIFRAFFPMLWSPKPLKGFALNNGAPFARYAYKKDTKGERHGTAAERLIAANTAANKSAAKDEGGVRRFFSLLHRVNYVLFSVGKTPQK